MGGWSPLPLPTDDRYRRGATVTGAPRPLTLRDARRIVATDQERRWRIAIDGLDVCQGWTQALTHRCGRLSLGVRPCPLPLGSEWDAGPDYPASHAGREAVLRWLDREIQRFGADAPFEPLAQQRGEARPKGTSETAEVSGDPSDGRLHGGDGHAGECDAPAETSSPMSQEGDDSHHTQVPGVRGDCGPGSRESGEPDAPSGRGREPSDSAAPRPETGGEPDSGERRSPHEGKSTAQVAPGAAAEPDRGESESPTAAKPPGPSQGRSEESGEKVGLCEGCPAPGPDSDADAPAEESDLGREAPAAEREDAGGGHSWAPRHCYGGETTDPAAVRREVERYRRHPAVRR